jgi:dinuclear metal center YbgI/SA1388 family protein
MKIKEIIDHLEAFAPPEYQEEYDNSGLIAGDVNSECTGVLLSLDCTEQCVREAIEKNCNFIVSHHPLIFRPVRQVVPENAIGKALMAAIKADLVIYSIHTNLDNILAGVNATIADRLDLVNRKILLPKKDLPFVGSGLVGELKQAIPEKQLLAKLRITFGVPVIRHSPLRYKPVSRVAICGGAGSFLITNALHAEVDFFITADIKYHDFFDTGEKMVIADIGHFESEQFTVNLLHSVILEKYPNFAVLKSGTVTNPVNYYI